MKYILTLLLSGLFTGSLFAQTSIGTTSPDHSAMLDVSATDKGLLVPRVTAAQRVGIKDPAHGLIVFQTGDNSGFYYNNGSPAAPSWVMLIGDSLPQNLTYKTITSGTNDVTANRLRTTAGDVDITRAVPPAPGQVLTATGPSEASWQAPAAGGRAYLFAYTEHQQKVAAGASIDFESVPVAKLMSYDRGTRSIVASVTGDYRVTYSLNAINAAVAPFVYVNGTVVGGSQYACAASDRIQTTTQLLVHLNAGDHITLANGSKEELILFSFAAQAATIVTLIIEKID